MRKLASIQKIKEIIDHPNADRLDILSFESITWKCVSQKGNFKAGEYCVYFEIDSLIPMKHEWARFLQDKNKPQSPARLKTIKLRGQQSQGLAMPVSILPSVEDAPFAIEDGADVTELLGVTKYEPVIPACLDGEVRGARPPYTIETDEDRVQAFPTIIDEFQGQLAYCAQKIDGTSGTYSYLDGDYQVAGRNWSYLDSEKNTYWDISRKYEIQDKLKYINGRSGENYAIQGEVAGPRIQGNLLQLKEHELFVFNVMKLNTGKFLPFYEFKEFCERLELQTVPILKICEFNYKTIEELMKYANSTHYPSGHVNEGHVWRLVNEGVSVALGGRASFKVISDDFLIKTGH
jgi:RNA ligase (TIGR02306 family)